MKYDRLVIWAAIAVVVVLLLAGCQRVSAPPEDTDASGDTSPGPEAPPIVYVDPGTGCQYLGYVVHGLTPRRREDGTQICTQLRNPVQP